MIAFHGKQEIKEKYLARVLAHQKADEIIKGQYWSKGKGCAVGCTIHGSEHSKYETELGIPTWLARVEDRLFEGMSSGKAKEWPAQFLKAIKPGADLEQAKAPFLICVLESALKSFAHNKNPKVVESIQSVIALWKRKDVGTKEWRAAADAAAYAAADAAYAADAAAYAAAAAADAAYAADAAADAAVYAAYAAADAAYAAADAAAYAAYAAARTARFDYFAEELLKILRKCK